MRSLDVALMKMIGMEAQTTSDLMARIFEGEPEWKRKQMRGHVLTALGDLERDGKITSRICRTAYSGPVSRYWALPGGRFPQELDCKALTTRLINALSVRPMSNEELFTTVYYSEEKSDKDNAMKRLNKALYRLEDQGMVQKETEFIRASQWRLVE